MTAKLNHVVNSLKLANASKADENKPATTFDFSKVKQDSTSTKPINLLELFLKNYDKIAKFYEDKTNFHMMSKLGKDLKMQLYSTACDDECTKVSLMEGLTIRMQFPDPKNNYKDELTWSRFCAISALYLTYLSSRDPECLAQLPTALGSSLRVDDSADDTCRKEFELCGWFALPGVGYLPNSIRVLKTRANDFKDTPLKAIATFYSKNTLAGVALCYCAGLSFVIHQKENGRVHDNASEYIEYFKSNPAVESGSALVAAYRQDPALSANIHIDAKNFYKECKSHLIYIESKEAFVRTIEGLESLDL